MTKRIGLPLAAQPGLIQITNHAPGIRFWVIEAFDVLDSAIFLYISNLQRFDYILFFQQCKSSPMNAV